MSILICLFLASIFLAEYVALKLGFQSPYIALMPEVMSVIFALIIVGRALVTRRWQQPFKYVVIFIVLILVCLVGAVAETVSPGTLVAGLREYFKYLPLFFLPAAVQFNKRDLYFIVGCFLFLAAIQVPLAFYQRFVEFAHAMHTGDPISGTVTTSSSLTITLCIAIAVIMTLYVNRKLTFPIAGLLFCYFAAPTAINETKATVLLLPIATLGPFILSKYIKEKWKRAVPVLVLCGFGLVSFIVVYNTLIEARWWGGGHEIGDFFAEGHVQSYLYRGVSEDGPPDVVGRLDSMLFPITILSDSWMKLIFGLGPGNVSPAFLPGMQGEYFETYKDYGVGMTSMGNLIWELGLAGVGIYTCLYFFIWRDARHVSKSGSAVKWMGDWWSACTLILFLGLFYKHILLLPEVGYLLFFFSGYIASLRMAPSDSPAVQDEVVQQTVKLKLAGESS